MPTEHIDFTNDEMFVTDILVNAKITSSKSEAKQLILQGGISIDDEKVSDAFQKISKSQFDKGYIVVKKGKKVFHRIILK